MAAVGEKRFGDAMKIQKKIDDIKKKGNLKIFLGKQWYFLPKYFFLTPLIV